MTNHCRKRGRFTRARTADDDDKATLVHDDVLEDRRQIQVFERRNLSRDRTQNGADVALLNKRAHAEPPNALRCNRKVTFLGRVEFLDLFVVHDGAHHHGRLISRQRRVGRLVNRAIYLDGRGKAASDEQVRTVALDHLAQQVLRQAYRLLAFH